MATPTLDTIADLLDELGGVPAWRVLRRPAPGTATEDDVLRLADGEPKRLCELVEGVLVEKPIGFRESMLAAALIEYLRVFIRPRRLGIVAGEQGLMRLAPGLVRIPDVSFVTRERLANVRAGRHAIADFVPDLAIEVLSASNTRAEMARKRREYFAAGTRLVWEVEPVTRTVDVYTDPVTPTRLTEADTLGGEPVLPGFTLSLRELFAELDDLPTT